MRVISTRPEPQPQGLVNDTNGEKKKKSKVLCILITGIHETGWHIGMACIAMAYIDMAYIVMACIVMACTVMACIVMTHNRLASLSSLGAVCTRMRSPAGVRYDAQYAVPASMS